MPVSLEEPLFVAVLLMSYRNKHGRLARNTKYLISSVLVYTLACVYTSSSGDVSNDSEMFTCSFIAL